MMLHATSLPWKRDERRVKSLDVRPGELGLEGRAHVAGLNGELDVVAQFQRVGDAFGLGEVEEDFADDVAALDEAETLLERAHDALVAHRMRRVLQTNVSSAQIAAAANFQIPSPNLSLIPLQVISQNISN